MVQVFVPGVTGRRELGAFLRTRRNALRAADVGLSGGGPRRHVQGLRREEVAALAGISTTWYTWIEQGREINSSPEVLQQVGAALRLEPHEIDYMMKLLRGPDPATFSFAPEIPESLRLLVENYEAAPAYIATPRFDLLVWNDFVGDVFGYERDGDSRSLNVLWRMFFDRTRRELYLDWEKIARDSVALFRHVYASYRGNPHFEELLDEMLTDADFARIWSLWEIDPPGRTAPFMVRDRTRGVCRLAPTKATLDVAPGCYLAVFSCTPVE